MEIHSRSGVVVMSSVVECLDLTLRLEKFDFFKVAYANKKSIFNQPDSNLGGGFRVCCCGGELLCL